MKTVNILVGGFTLATALIFGTRSGASFPGVLVISLVGWMIYFIPSYIASNKNHPSKTPIIVLNALGGWLVLGWLVAIVWAVMDKKSATASSENVAHNNAVIPASPPKVQPTDITTQLAKLDDLRNKGALSEEEFQAAKSKLLN